MIGQVLGSYRVVSRLGAGGMGTVWLAEHTLLGSRAAIKVLLPEMSEQKRIVERFFDEARAATRIQDPGIVTVLDFGWHSASAYIVMEHLNGETLTARLVKSGTLPPLTALRMLQHCAIAMAAAHARGIVHRDLKPDNIFIVSDPAVPGGERTKVLDFGIAKLIDDADANHSRTKTGVIMGTPAYMSPEQCRGAGGVDHRTDIYALGCVLFHMLIGHPPFVGPTAGDLIAMHLREWPTRPGLLRDDLPPALDDLVLRCLAKSPDERYQTMTELVRASSLLSGENLSIETIPPLRASKELHLSSEAPPTEPPAVAAVANTTLRGSTGETFSRTRPWRGGMIVAGLALAMIGLFAVMATRGSRKQEAASAGPSGSAPPPAIDASAVAATPDAAVPDAAPSVVIPTPKPKPPKKPKKPAGSGSDEDPYETR